MQRSAVLVIYAPAAFPLLQRDSVNWNFFEMLGMYHVIYEEKLLIKIKSGVLFAFRALLVVSELITASLVAAAVN